VMISAAGRSTGVGNTTLSFENIEPAVLLIDGSGGGAVISGSTVCRWPAALLTALPVAWSYLSREAFRSSCDDVSLAVKG
jgi:hypothetical protein